MVETELTRELIDSGDKLIRRLEENDLSPDVAFWLNSEEEPAWKLVLVESKLSSEGPRAGYTRLQKILSQYGTELDPLELGDVTIEKPESRIVRLIRKAVRTKDKPVRFRNNMLDGIPIGDAYIYRTAR